MREDALQREHSLREVFNALRYIARGGETWRMMPYDMPSWPVIHQQIQRWYKGAGVFEAMVHDLLMFPRDFDERQPHPTVAINNSTTIQSTPKSGG